MKILLLVFCLLVSQNSFAITTIQLSIEQLLLDYSSADSKTKQNIHFFQLDKINIELDLGVEPMTLTLNLEEINFPEPYRKLSSLKLICKDFSIDTFSKEQNSISCHKGEILANHSFFKNLNAKVKFKEDSLTPLAGFSFNYNLTDNTLILSINELNINNGFISINLQLNRKLWDLELKGKDVNYIDIKNYLDFYLDEAISSIDVTSGQINFMAHLNGEIVSEAKKNHNTFTMRSAEAKGDINKISYSINEDLADNLSFNFDISFKNNIKRQQTVNKQTKPINSQISFMLDKISGEIIQKDIYISFNGKERITAQITIPENKNNLREEIFLTDFDLFFPDILHFKSTGKFSLYPEAALKNLTAHFEIMNYEQLNNFYLKNILEGSDYEGFKITGKSDHTIDVNYRNNSQHIDIISNIKDLSFSFADEFSFKNLNGSIVWSNYSSDLVKDTDSYLSWTNASLNNLPLGQTNISFMTHQNNISLTQTAYIPIFDGELQIDNLNISHIGQSNHSDKDSENNMTVVINGLIKPISLKLISEHFNWPILDGKLSAVIPTTSYNEQHFIIGGAMMLQVFDGFIVLKDLEIQNPLQEYARLEGNIDIKNLNLKNLTKTYDFGEIQGRIDGHLSNLILESWQPIAFDATLETPENDKSRHRISQRAIDNLSSLGGMSGLLSRSFLSIFETFGYNKIGLRCRLENNICSMSGVEKKGDGYYIVKGGGIPRIDVIGFQKNVDWTVLISRLKAIQSTNQAVIQ